jgi:alanyl-tRNA synthetase
MTERLYYSDPDLLEFEAEVVAVERRGDDFYTILSRSAFYPTSGGQSNDTGKLGVVDVTDVVENADGDVEHVTRAEVGAPSNQIQGTVNGERRWRNRQMHTAQHLLSQLFIARHNAETVSVHLGDEYGAVELNTESVSPEDLTVIEKEANLRVREGLAVEVLFVEGDALKDIPLRKVPERAGRLRIIKIGELDYSACGGTHCNNTAQVGIIKIIGTEKLRGNLLVKFLSGSQSLDDYIRRFGITDSLSKSQTCHFIDLEEKIGKLTDEHRSMRKEIVSLQKELAPIRVQQLLTRKRQIGACNVIFEDAGDLDPSIVNDVARQAAEGLGGLVVLMVNNRLVFAASEQSGIHAGQLVKRFTEDIGLRGGGSERMAQVGGANPAAFTTYVETVERLIADV